VSVPEFFSPWFPVEADLFPHVLDSVERSDAAGVDDAGNPVVAWTQVYAGLRAAVIPGEPQDFLEWQQRGIKASHKVYVRHFDDGTLAVISNRCRATFGRHTDGSPRYFVVRHAHSLAEAGLVQELSCDEVIPGGAP
jgi:hypothetical protein